MAKELRIQLIDLGEQKPRDLQEVIFVSVSDTVHFGIFRKGVFHEAGSDFKFQDELVKFWAEFPCRLPNVVIQE